ncbi:MAG: signal peptide peptidase SppA [Saprospirales bacterium]|jgi:protease-4|nr:signal peptide peptidase SppA [Saprospirales bacterium]
MGQFFKFMFASCLGVILAGVVLSLVSIGIMVQIAGQANKPKGVKPNTVLHLSLEQPVPEQTNNLEMNPFDFKNQYILGLSDMVQAIKYAKTDDRVQGIYLDMKQISLGSATAGALRQALLDFKTSGKFIYAYSDYYQQGTYYIASAADQIYLNPIGDLDFRGFAMIQPFFKNMLDKIGVNMQVTYAGNYKSATEPFRLTEMSPENREQVREFVESLYDSYLSGIGESRKLTVTELKDIANGWKIRNPEDAVKLGLVDVAGYKDQLMAEMRKKMGLEDDDKIPFLDLADYYMSEEMDQGYSADQIAVVYAEGSIQGGEGQPGLITDEQYVKWLEKIRKDDDIKAVVLRVNSPGGSALASENIWRELKLIKEAGKPIVVSMGDFAASGGYYISCMADSIYAEPTTLTGSIGVFSMMPNVEELFEEKLGITFDTVKTGQYSTSLTPFYAWTDPEHQIMQADVNEIYETFLQRVAEGRGMTRDQVHEIAQGRVWTGEKALQLGLVDGLGGMEQALTTAASLAGIDDYWTKEYPVVKDPIKQFMETFMDDEEDIRSRMISRELGGEYGDLYDYYRDMRSAQGVQARLPFIFRWN